MRRVRYHSVLFVVGAFMFGCAPRGENPEQMIAAAKALDQRFLEAYSKTDVDGVMACYWNSPDLVNYPPGAMEERGWQAVKDGIAEFFASAPGLKAELLETNYRVAGDVVFGWGKWRITIPTGGEPMVISGRYTDIKARRDGKWVYVLDHASVPLPPPASGSSDE